MSLYRSVSQALRSAYGYESRDILQHNRIFADLRGGGVRLRTPEAWEGLTAWERVAQSAYVMLLVRQTLSAERMNVVDAYYTLPSVESLAIRKHGACVTLARRARDVVDGSPPWDFTLATVAEWAGVGKVKPKEWAEKLAVNPSTLRRWRTGRGEYGSGIVGVLDDWLDLARRDLGGPMRDAGLLG
jgi:hypothetical protein